ncbi:hypothetical protein EC843_1011432 [Buttiauxella sp. JUb87]|nr:hypothetical protein EC843_1011432 [Buttiauxella sp. JUb87]
MLALVLRLVKRKVIGFQIFASIWLHVDIWVQEVMLEQF